MKLKNCAIIAAAGKGKRMGANINKQFLPLKGKPILYYTLKIFCENKLIDDIIISASSDEIAYINKNIIEKYNFKKIKTVVEGGSERQDSIFNALKVAKGYDIIVIHDGARPFVSDDIIEKGIYYANIYGAAACGVNPKDTIKLKDEKGYSKGTLDRDKLFCIQTPQSFKYDLIMDCHKKIKKEGIRVTDDTAVVENYGNKVYLYNGSYNNIKITTPEDMIVAENLINNIYRY